MKTKPLCQLCRDTIDCAPHGAGACYSVCKDCSIESVLDYMNERGYGGSTARKGFRIDSHRLLEWINLVTLVHNDVIKGQMFSSGYNLCLLQQNMVEVLKDLERQERTWAED